VTALYLLAGAAIGVILTLLLVPKVRHKEISVPPGDDSSTPPELPLRDALDALRIGMVLAGPDGTEVYRNAMARGLTGTRPADVLVEEALERHLALAAAGHPMRQVLEVYGPPRRVVEVQASDLGGQGAMVIVEDITERSRLDTVRTDFVANISHELKTPVGAIAVLAEALAGEDDPAVVQRFVGKMVDEAHRVGRTIDDLLELARIELGGEAVRDVLRADVVLEDALERSRPLADRRSISLQLGEVSEYITMLGDRRQLVSAIANLVENGVKYSEPSTIVTVSAHTDGQWVELRVADHGIGIPARDLDRIFERFYRVDRARSRETGGTGLGLAIVRHVATNHGGTVHVDSTEGEGSTFTLRIPAGPGPMPVSLESVG
jgi:two-component system, OmpR family, sensor histidine kinase SenX3